VTRYRVTFTFYILYGLPSKGNAISRATVVSVLVMETAGQIQAWLHSFATFISGIGDILASHVSYFAVKNDSRCPMNRRMGGPQRRSGRLEEEKSYRTSAEN
jgi:hypothetical protein